MGFDNEQIVERAHARENALSRIYCNVQDENRKYRLIYLRTFLDHSAFMQEMTEKLKIIRQQRSWTQLPNVEVTCIVIITLMVMESLMQLTLMKLPLSLHQQIQIVGPKEPKQNNLTYVK